MLEGIKPDRVAFGTRVPYLHQKQRVSDTIYPFSIPFVNSKLTLRFTIPYYSVNVII